MNVVERLAAFRAEMKSRGISAYIIPTDDYHASEYVGEYFKARAYFSGFSGSAGTLVVMENEAALWTDGRYFLQAGQQLEGTGIILMKMGEEGVPSIGKYLEEKMKAGTVVGFDGRTVTNSFILELMNNTETKSIQYDGNLNLADFVWKDRPEMSKEPVWELDAKLAGMTREEKIEAVRIELAKNGADYLVTTALDEIAWILNLRGYDVAYTPVFLSYLLIGSDKAVLCVQKEKLPQQIIKNLAQTGIEIRPYDDIRTCMEEIPAGKIVQMDAAKVNYQLYHCLGEGVKRKEAVSPVVLMKAKKTEAEMENIRKAHVKDGIAVTRFIKWLKESVPNAGITELQASDQLLEYRKEQPGFIVQSFSPIVAYDDHAAIIHYNATEATNAVMYPKGYCLVDTGGHYEEGSTDITRTIALGDLSYEEKKTYTLVLRGHLNLAAAKFAYGVSGQQLDVLARQPLWEEGLDFRHGTGHGVGYILSVHEGPQRIMWRTPLGQVPAPLEEGMLMSDEPGYYCDGKFGIRLENLVLCRKGPKTEYGQFMYLENLTYAPFEREAILPELMSDRELKQLNDYHESVFVTLFPYLNKEEQDWLRERTRPIIK